MKTLRKLLLLSAIAIGISFGSAQAQPQGPYGLVQLKAYIDSLIYNNTTHDITGQRLNDVLTTIINSLQNTVDEDDFTFIDTIDVSADPDYPEADAGDVYLALVPGKIGGPSGLEVNVGDMMVCLFDSTPSGDQVTVGEFWNILQGRLTTDFYDAIENANAPDAANPFATMDDVGATGYTDITWANLLTAISGNGLSPGAWYHVTTAPDGSTTIDEAWVHAKDSNEIFPFGHCLINAANITNRMADIRFNMAGGVGGKIQEVYDGFGNIIQGPNPQAAGTNTTTYIDRWLDILLSTNINVKVWGAFLGVTATSGTVGDNSTFMPGSMLDMTGASQFIGHLGYGANATLTNASTANNVTVLYNLNLDNATILANSYVGMSKILTIADGLTYMGFSTDGNTYVHQDGSNPSGDIVTVAATDGIVYIVDGATDITVNMPTGLIEGQQMIIFFKNGSAAVTWGGAAVDVSFIAAPPAGWRLNTFWDSANSTWR